MTCTNDLTCSGRVDSDIGWSADIMTTNGEYVVKRRAAELGTLRRTAAADRTVISGTASFRLRASGIPTSGIAGVRRLRQDQGTKRRLQSQ